MAQREGIDFDIGNLGINLQTISDRGWLDRLFHHVFSRLWMDRARNVLFAASRRRKRARAAVEKAVRLVRVLCDDEQTEVFLDTMKDPLQLPHLARRTDVDLRLIALVRDGRGVMNSMMRKENQSPQQAVGTWVWSSRRLLRVARYFTPADVFWLHLEDLCKAPEETIADLLAFCGVDRIPSIDFSRLYERHVIGNRMRLNFDGVIQLDESWKRELAIEHLDLFEREAGRLNLAFGYHD